MGKIKQYLVRVRYFKIQSFNNQVWNYGKKKEIKDFSLKIRVI